MSEKIGENVYKTTAKKGERPKVIHSTITCEINTEKIEEFKNEILKTAEKYIQQLKQENEELKEKQKAYDEEKCVDICQDVKQLKQENEELKSALRKSCRTCMPNGVCFITGDKCTGSAICIRKLRRKLKKQESILNELKNLFINKPKKIIDYKLAEATRLYNILKRGKLNFPEIKNLPFEELLNIDGIGEKYAYMIKYDSKYLKSKFREFEEKCNFKKK